MALRCHSFDRLRRCPEPVEGMTKSVLDPLTISEHRRKTLHHTLHKPMPPRPRRVVVYWQAVGEVEGAQSCGQVIFSDRLLVRPETGDQAMPTSVRLFISGGPDQEPAREALGRALAEFPVNVGWVIKRTPDVDSVAECHLYLLLMGVDIVAPVGLELWWARRTEKPILAYRRDVIRTPAGQVFLQENAGLDWMRYADLAGLRRAVVADLARFVLRHAERYGLTPLEIDRLHVLITQLRKAAARLAGAGAEEEAEPEPAGAGGGGVILAPGKDEPPGARVIGEAV